jgi:outer membrane protein
MTHLLRLDRLGRLIAVVALTLGMATQYAAAQAQPPAQQAAQTPAGVPFAWVNSQQILPQVPGYAQAESTLNAEVAAYRAEVEHMQAQLDSMVREYDRQQIALSPSTRQTKQQEIRDTQQRLQQRYNDLQDKAASRERELVSPLEERVKGIIEGIRAERNLLFIFDVGAPGNNIVAADRALDLTSVVVQRLQTTQ